MKFYCDKNTKTINHSCKKHLVVIERGISKIFYLRFYKEKKVMTYKEISGNDEYLAGLIDFHKDKMINEDTLKFIIQNVRDTYNLLKETGQEKKTLETLSACYSSNGNMQFDNGIFMEDESIVYFYDFSAKMDGILNTLFKGGIL